MGRFSMGRRVVPALVVAGVLGIGYAVAPVGAEQPQRATPVDSAALAKALMKLDDDWSAAAATRDASKVSAFYAEDAIAYPPNEPVAIGRSAAEKVWAAYFAEPTFAISWKSDHAEVAQNGDMGFTSGAYQCSFTGPDGKEVREIGKFLCVWKKQKDGSWKAVHDMWNADAR